MKAIKLTELKTTDGYFYPICNIGYYSINKESNHLFIMMVDGRNNVTYKLEEYSYEIIEL